MHNFKAVFRIISRAADYRFMCASHT